jgi:hypothetical protein
MSVPEILLGFDKSLPMGKISEIQFDLLSALIAITLSQHTKILFIPRNMFFLFKKSLRIPKG